MVMALDNKDYLTIIKTFMDVERLKNYKVICTPYLCSDRFIYTLWKNNLMSDDCIIHVNDINPIHTQQLCNILCDSPHEETHKHVNNARCEKCELISYIRDLWKNEKLIITNVDGIELIDKYIDNKDAFIYIDSPYLFTEESYNKGITLFKYICEGKILQANATFIIILMLTLRGSYKYIESKYTRRYNNINRHIYVKRCKKDMVHKIICNK